MVAHLLVLSVFKVDGVVSHAEDSEDEIDEGENAVQPQEMVSVGEEGIGKSVVSMWHVDQPGA